MQYMARNWKIISVWRRDLLFYHKYAFRSFNIKIQFYVKIMQEIAYELYAEITNSMMAPT